MRLQSRLACCLLAATACFACSSGKSNNNGNSDAGGDGGAAFVYSPQGCAYTVSPPDTRGFTDLALDDSSPVDPTTGVPARVRVGLGGNTTGGQPGYADPSTTAAFTWETTAGNHAAKVKLGSDPNNLTQV